MNWGLKQVMKRETKCVLMAIKPKFAEAIRKGEKTIELRKVAPRIMSDDIILFYESAPVKSISFFCRVDAIIRLEPKMLWDQYSQALSISKEEYTSYYRDKAIAYGIKLKEPQVFLEKKQIQDVDESLVVPQSYVYVSSKGLKKVLRWAVRVNTAKN